MLGMIHLSNEQTDHIVHVNLMLSSICGGAGQGTAEATMYMRSYRRLILEHIYTQKKEIKVESAG